MRKVLHLRSSGGVLGAENVILELGVLTEQHGYRSTVGAIHRQGDPLPEFIRFAQKKNLDTAIFTARRRFDYRCIQAIRGHIQQNRFDLIHCHGYKEDFYGFLAARHNPRVATNHLWKQTSWRSRAYAFLDSLILRGFAAAIGVSDEIVADMRRRGITAPVKIANGIDCSRYVPRGKKSAEMVKRLNVRPGSFILGMVSSLTPVKGHRYAIQALARVKEKIAGATICVAGKGACADELKRLSDDLGIADRVEFIGAEDDIPAFLSVADIFLLPSLKEGLPMALLEAMASAKPAIASCVGEIPKVIDHGVSGLLVEPANVEQLSAAIMQLRHNPRLRRALGRKARDRVVRDYSSHAMARAYCALYERVLSNDIRETHQFI